MEQNKRILDANKLGYVAMGGIFVLFLLTRLWHLTDIPYGLHVDEASMAYSAGVSHDMEWTDT